MHPTHWLICAQVRGLVVGLLQAEDRMREFRDAHPEPNLDLQFVGVEGYAYP